MAKRGLSTNPFEEAKGRDALFAGIGDGSVEVADILVDAVNPDPNQVRRSLRDESFGDPDGGDPSASSELRSLAESIKAFGLSQPIHVYKSGHGSFTLLFGERRLRAAKMAGLETIQAVVYKDSPDNVTEMQLAENLHRKDLTDVEIFDALHRIKERRPDLLNKDLAELLGKSPQWVSRYLLLESPEYRQLLEDGTVSGTAVLAHLLTLPEEVRSTLVEEKRRLGKPVTYSDIKKVQKSLAITDHGTTLDTASSEGQPPPSGDDHDAKTRDNWAPENSDIRIFSSGSDEEEQENGDEESVHHPRTRTDQNTDTQVVRITLSREGYDRLTTLAREWDCSEGEVVERLLDKVSNRQSKHER